MRYLLMLLLCCVAGTLAAQQLDDPIPAAEAADELLGPEEGSTPDATQPTDAAEQTEQTETSGRPEPSAETDGTDEAAEPGESELIPPEEITTERFWSGAREMLDFGAIGLLREGGFFMWPILLMGILAAGVVIERYRSLKMLSTDSSALRNEVGDLLRADRVEEALKTCDAQQGPVPAVLSAGLRKFLVLRRLNYDPGRVEQQVVKAMDDYGVHIVAALERHLPILATVSSVAPMLGFLGTVQGMIIAFRDIVEKMGETNIVESAAAGIQTALLTTCFGLIIGIPAFIAYNYFTSVINRYVLEVEQSATDLIESVTLQLALAGRQTESQ